jgi:hypothetical protein
MKRITLKEWTYIGKYNPAAKWLRPFCVYTLSKKGNCFTRECKMSILLYLILFIPVHILQAFYCMWDGGLKEFSIEDRYLGYDNFLPFNEESYNHALEIWEKK